MYLVMTQYPLRLPIIFSGILCLLFIGCSKNNDTPTTNTGIETITLNASTKNYTIYANNTEIGTSQLTISTGIYKVFNDIPHDHVIEIKETTTINSSTGTHKTYSKKLPDGYTFLSDNNNDLNNKLIPFPLNINEQLLGPFSAITTNNISLFITDIHSSYTNKNGHIFNDVIEAKNNDDTIRIFLNNDEFIIQKEDYRYLPTIQSLKK